MNETSILDTLDDIKTKVELGLIRLLSGEMTRERGSGDEAFVTSLTLRWQDVDAEEVITTLRDALDAIKRDHDRLLAHLEVASDVEASTKPKDYRFNLASDRDDIALCFSVEATSVSEATAKVGRAFGKCFEIELGDLHDDLAHAVLYVNREVFDPSDIATIDAVDDA